MISYVWTAVITALFLAQQSMQNPHQGRTHTRVAVYRGPGTIDGTPESAAELFTSAWKDSRVTYVGPKEHVKITRAALGEFDVYIQPGGGDLDPAWKTMKEFNDTIRDFVSNGGHYLGFCLGAYLAGQGPGFDLFPPGVDTDQEIAQVRNHDESDTVIQVDWTFSTGEKRGRTEKNRWLYFQDGAAILGSLGRPGDRGKVLGRYSKSGDAAAYVVRYGDGVVGVVGPHPEATKDWYDEYGIKNPTGYDLDVGRDFIRAVMEYKGCD